MEMQQLHYFVSVYRSKSITRSADDCHITVQGISLSIHRLEDELGEKLFERTSKGLVPTEYADYLFIRANRILNARDECVAFFQKNRNAAKTCRVSLAQGTVEEYVGPLLKEFKDSHPKVHLDIHENSDKNCIDDVLTGSTELAVVGGPIKKELFDIVELFSIRYVLITPCGSPWANRETIYISDLPFIPIAILDDCNSTHSMLISQCEREEIELNIFCIPKFVLSLFSMVENGLCSGIVTESLAHRMANPKISIVPINHPKYSWKISVIKPKNAVLSKEAEDMWNLLTTGGNF